MQMEHEYLDIYNGLVDKLRQETDKARQTLNGLSASEATSLAWAYATGEHPGEVIDRGGVSPFEVSVRRNRGLSVNAKKQIIEQMRRDRDEEQRAVLVNGMKWYPDETAEGRCCRGTEGCGGGPQRHYAACEKRCEWVV